MKFLPIPKDKVDVMWPYVAPVIEKAVNLTPDRIDINDLYEQAKKGFYILWIVFEEVKEQKVIQAVLTTRLSEYPKTKALCIDFVAGQRMKEWLPIVMPVFENLGKVNKCTHIEGYGRRAWKKYLEQYGWQQRHIQYEKRLDNE